MTRTLFLICGLTLCVSCWDAGQLLFPRSPGLPENLRKQIFSAANEPRDLIYRASELGKTESSLLGAWLSPESPNANSALTAYLSTLVSFEVERADNDSFPVGIPPTLSAEDWKTALNSFPVASAAVAIESAFTSPEFPPLLVRREESPKATSLRPAVWQGTIFSYRPSPVDVAGRAAADTTSAYLASIGAKNEPLTKSDYIWDSVRISKTYVRSLFRPRAAIVEGQPVTLPGESYQILIHCVQANAAQGSLIWPQQVVIETGTGSAQVTRLTLLRSNLWLNPATGRAEVPANPDWIEVLQRSAGDFYSFVSWANPSQAHGVFSAWFYQEAFNVYVTRFGSLSSNGTHTSQVFGSALRGQSALVVEGEGTVLADGSLPTLSAEQLSQGGGDDAWTSAPKILRKTVSAQETDFSPRGIHALPDLNGAFFSATQPPQSFAALFALAQAPFIGDYCARLF